MRLLYVMDPMCAWCYGFQPELDDFLQNHPSADVEWIMGGLAPDSSQPMDQHLRETIASYWHVIEDKTRVSFNHDYWTHNTPYRSTYPACRAVISAESLKPGSAPEMVKAIQAAYYQQATNPSLAETLIDCAISIGLDREGFREALASEETEQRFQQHLSLTYQLRITGFPALLHLTDRQQAYPLALGYCDVETLEQALMKAQDAS